MNLQDIYSKLQSSSNNQYTIYFIKRDKTRGAVRYSTIKSKRTPKLGDTFKKNAIESTKYYLNRTRSFVSYDSELSQRRGLIQTIDVDNVPNFFSLVDSCVQNGASNIREPKQLAKNLWGYVIKIYDPSTRDIIYLFSKYTPAELIEAKKSLFQMRGRTITPISQREAFSINKGYHAVVMYSYEGNAYSPLYVISRVEFEEFFSFKEYYVGFINSKKDELKDTNLIDDTDAFVERCSKNFPYSLRLSRIMTKDRYKSITITRISTLIAERNLDIKIINGKMKFEKKSAEQILDILDDNFVNSALTKAKYRITGSKTET